MKPQQLSQRMATFDMTAVRAMFERAALLKNPIDLSVGQPDFDVPELVKEEAINAIRNGKNRYTPAGGLPAFKTAIAEELKRDGIGCESVMAVSGASGGLLLALWALADENCEVLVPDPYFIGYPHLIRLAGAEVRFIDTYPKMRLTPELLQTAIQQSPASRKILLFNSPVNPSGIVYSEDEIKALVAVTKRHGVQVICDEVYDKFTFDAKFISWARFDNLAVVVRALGKSWAMTGWRCGLAGGPRHIIDAMTALQQVTFVCVNSPAQWAGIEAFKTDLKPYIDTYRRRRDLTYEMLRRRFELQEPQGAFYAFAKAPGGDVDRFLAKCLEKEVLVVAGSLFSQKNSHFRVSFALGDEKLKEGLRRLGEVADELG